MFEKQSPALLEKCMPFLQPLFCSPADSLSCSLHWFVKLCVHTLCVTINWDTTVTAPVHFSGVKWASWVRRQIAFMCACVCSNEPTTDYVCKFWCMKCSLTSTHGVEDKKGREKEKERVRGSCTYTCQVTLEQMVKSKYSTTGAKDSALTLWVCVHALVYFWLSVWMCKWMRLAMSSEVDCSQQPSGRQLAAGSSPEVLALWVLAYGHGLLAADLILCTALWTQGGFKSKHSVLFTAFRVIILYFVHTFSAKDIETLAWSCGSLVFATLVSKCLVNLRNKWRMLFFKEEFWSPLMAGTIFEAFSLFFQSFSQSCYTPII